MTQQIKVGDRVRGWTSRDASTRVRLEGTVKSMTENTLSLSEWKFLGGGYARSPSCAQQVLAIYRVDAELVSAALPFPKPIDWSKPLRTKSGYAVEYVGKLKELDKSGMSRVVSIRWPEGLTVHTVKENGQLQIANMEGSNDIENVPPEPKRRKVTVVMSKSGSVALHRETLSYLQKCGFDIVAAAEIELVEGEGVA